MNSKKQRHIINNLLNSPDLLGRCIGILKPEYFDPEYISHITFLLDYHHTHNANPSVKLMNAEVDPEEPYEEYHITTDELDYTAQEVESFARQSAMREAISESYDLIQKNDFGSVYKKVSEALSVSLARDLGLDVFDNPEEKLKKMVEELDYISCGIKTWDELMGGGNLRKQLQVVSANSGGGKSVCLSNIANNYVMQGLDVLYVSLELPPEMIFLRQAFIMTYCSHRVWKSKIFEIAEKIKHLKELGAGDFRIIRMAGGSNANDIRAFIKHYEIEMGKPPDVLIIDYMDLMTPNDKIHMKRGVSEEDRAKSKDIYELLHVYNMIGWTASQQNRKALEMDKPSHAAIAGGMSKIDICDNWLSVYASSEMRLEGEMLTYALKTRWGDGCGKKCLVAFDSETLKISDHTSPGKYEDVIQKIKNRANKKTGEDAKGESILNALVENGHITAPKENVQDVIFNKKIDALRDKVVDFSGEDEPLESSSDQSEEESENSFGRELDLLDFRKGFMR